jgi:hypothetical protein
MEVAGNLPAFFFVQEITLWRKGERVRKLPLGGSLYQQQQHALARHQPGEQPVRTAPTPSLPPTPCLIDTAESRLPGAAAEPKAEEAAGEVETKRRFFYKVTDPDPVSDAFLTLGSGSGIRCLWDLVSRITHPTHELNKTFLG